MPRDRVHPATGLACMHEFAEAVAVALVPILADLGGLGVAPFFHHLKGFIEGPLIPCCHAGAVAADEDHFQEVAVTVPPSCRAVQPQ